MKFLEFIFNITIGGNGNDHNIRLGDQFINKVEKLNNLGSIVQKTWGIVEDVVGKIRSD